MKNDPGFVGTQFLNVFSIDMNFFTVDIKLELVPLMPVRSELH